MVCISLWQVIYTEEGTRMNMKAVYNCTKGQYPGKNLCTVAFVSPGRALASYERGTRWLVFELQLRTLGMDSCKQSTMVDLIRLIKLLGWDNC